MSVNDERLIREVIEARVRAMEGHDGRGAVAVLAPDLVAFELMGPLQAHAAPAVDASAMQAWLDNWDGPVETELRDLTIHVAGDVAFCHSLNRLRASRSGGPRVDFWMRSTLGLLKRDGNWQIVHGHTSVPLRDDGSLQGAMDLEP
jgi:ketosteroid isomerase-like protein